MEESVFFACVLYGKCIGWRVVLHGDYKHIMDAGCFCGDETQVFRQLFACLNGVVQSISEDGADI